MDGWTRRDTLGSGDRQIRSERGGLGCSSHSPHLFLHFVPRYTCDVYVGGGDGLGMSLLVAVLQRWQGVLKF